MWKTSCVRMLTIAAATALVVGCASNAPKQTDYSGYLGNYSDLSEAKGPKGEEFLRYVSPRFTPANYHAVMVDKVDFYPKPEPTEQVSQQTIDQIGGYLNEALRKNIGEKVEVVEEPGPGVAELKVAITGVAGEKEGLKPYQIVPIAFVATMAYRGVAGTPQEAKLVVESEAKDSVSGEILLKSVRVGTGENLQKSASGERVVTLASVKPIIDRWAEEVAASATTYVRPRVQG